MGIRFSPRLRKYLILPPILVGVGFGVFLVATREGPRREPEQEVSRALRVVEVPTVGLVPRALAFGTAEPGRIWRAVAEVQGWVVEAHPELNSGAIMPEGATLLKIDRTEYDLVVAQLEARIEEVGAQLAELDVKEENYRASLKLENASLELARDALARSKELLGEGNFSQAKVDQDEREVLRQRESCQQLENSLNLIPATRKSLQATLAVHQAGLADAKLDLTKTEIKVPFDCRLGDVNIEKGQFLSVGELLVEAHGTDLTEVEGSIAIVNVRCLLEPRAVTRPPVGLEMKLLRELFNVKATVRLRTGGAVFEWPGRFSRLREAIDPETGTLKIVIAVDEPYQQALSGERPPLLKGMFCEVELRGPTREKQIVVPRAAVHDGHVFLVNGDRRLERRSIVIDFAQSNFVVVREGLEPGETVIVSDPTPAIEGMLVSAVPDPATLETLLAEARGTAELR